MGAISVLRHEPPLGKFERLLYSVIASRILERKRKCLCPEQNHDNQSIDSELFRSPDTLLETVRLAAQVYYYGLLIQLHLPYMMRLGDNTEREYSKIACVNGSREMMTRFISHRSFNPMSFGSRPVDFFALLEAMTLLLVHLDAHHQREATNFLAHQRLSDRAMLNKALKRMDVISNVSKDVVTEKSAELNRRLLDIEADAAEESSYTARSVRGDGDMQEGTKEGEELRLHIPYLSVIKISRPAPSLESRRSRMRHLGRIKLPSHLHDMAQGSAFSGDLPASGRPNAQLQAPGYEQSMLQYPSSSHDNITLQHHMGLPPIAVGVNE
ncbi:hypothetical protein DL767_004574 [Monosporascus sp. MG133]|nr:hypothetical protein DL767_004574 [Monosporascus sp. MG133]